MLIKHIFNIFTRLIKADSWIKVSKLVLMLNIKGMITLLHPDFFYFFAVNCLYPAPEIFLVCKTASQLLINRQRLRFSILCPDCFVDFKSSGFFSYENVFLDIKEGPRCCLRITNKQNLPVFHHWNACSQALSIGDAIQCMCVSECLRVCLCAHFYKSTIKHALENTWKKIIH